MLDATPLLRLYARHRLHRLGRMQPSEEQRRQLFGLLRKAKDTRFGKDHDFGSITSIEGFQNRVPLGSYDIFWERYWKDAFPRLTDLTWPGTIPYFAATSGTTTGRTKYIPLTREMLAENRKGALDLMTFHVAARPASRVLGGKNFMLGGATALEELAPGVCKGDMSGIVAREVPRWIKPWYFPRRELALIEDWERKIRELGPRSLQEDIRTIGGTASWLLLFLQELATSVAGQDGRLVDIYPDLELVVHGGVSFDPYRAQFERLLEGSHAELREVYPASEGFIAVADRGVGEGLRMILDGGIFYEFVPAEALDEENPPRFWLGNAEVGVNYALVLSSCAGLWSYMLGDTVRLVDLDPPRLVVTGRTSYSLSAFGEHLIGEEIERAVTVAAAEVGEDVIDFSVGPVFPEGPTVIGGHLYVVEFAEGVPNEDVLRRFADVVDRTLCDLNIDYKDHRAEGFGMKPPRVLAVPHGTFVEWMRARGKLGGQNKVPRILTDRELFKSLQEHARRQAGTIETG